MFDPREHSKQELENKLRSLAGPVPPLDMSCSAALEQICGAGDLTPAGRAGILNLLGKSDASLRTGGLSTHLLQVDLGPLFSGWHAKDIVELYSEQGYTGLTPGQLLALLVHQREIVYLMKEMSSQGSGSFFAIGALVCDGTETLKVCADGKGRLHFVHSWPASTCSNCFFPRIDSASFSRPKEEGEPDRY